MLKMRTLLFPVTFLVFLLLALALGLHFLTAFLAEPERRAGYFRGEGLLLAVYLSGVFLVLSGYAVAVCLGYWLAPENWSDNHRTAVHVALFPASYGFFVLIMDGNFGLREAILLFVGILSVLLADRLARAALRSRS